MSKDNPLEFFQNYNRGLDPIWIDVVFGVFLFSFFVIGMLLGIIRGSWFFLITLIFVSIAWATSAIIGEEIYATIFKDQFKEAYQNVEKLKDIGINLQPSITQFLGFIYMVVATIGATIFLTFPLFIFFSKNLSKYIKKMSKYKKGLSIFLGGMSGLLFSFLLGFPIFFPTSNYSSIVFKSNSIKFQNFYCSIMSCEYNSFKSSIDTASLLVNSLKEKAYENKDFTYTDLIKGIYEKNDEISLIDINEVSILTNLDNLFNLSLLFLNKGGNIDGFLNIFQSYRNFEYIFDLNFTNLNKEEKKLFLNNWITTIIPTLSPWYVELGNSLISEKGNYTKEISLLKSNIFEKAGLFVIKISLFLEDAESTLSVTLAKKRSIINNIISNVQNI